MKFSEIRKVLRESNKQWWCVYLLEGRDGSYYCGITNDLERRIKQHNSGTGAKYTKGRGPVKLIGSKLVQSRSDALKLESLVKRKKKGEKVKFLLGQ